MSEKSTQGRDQSDCPLIDDGVANVKSLDCVMAQDLGHKDPDYISPPKKVSVQNVCAGKKQISVPPGICTLAPAFQTGRLDPGRRVVSGTSDSVFTETSIRSPSFDNVGLVVRNQPFSDNESESGDDMTSCSSSLSEF